MPVTRSVGHTATNLLSAAIKVVGLASAVNQLLLQPHPQSVALAVSAFMLAGAEVSESLILSILDRLVGARPEQPGEAPEPPKGPLR